MANVRNALVKLSFLALITSFTLPAMAEGKKQYGEIEFLDAFSGKSAKVILKTLGKPVKKNLSVKPSNADNIVGGYGKEAKSSKRVKIEMWYYKNIVKYDDKHTYKETEITLVNDRVQNIGFFNNR